MATKFVLLFLFFFCCCFHGYLAEDPDLYFNWRVSYSTRSPFGVDKKVIVINDQLPRPLLNATTNNVLHVNVFNNLDEPFLLTWNGVQMRKNSWNDGVRGTNCPIPAGKNWTYVMQVKDQIGSFFYFPSLAFQMAAGGYGPIRINNRIIIPIPFSLPYDDVDILIADWYNMDYKRMRNWLDLGFPLSRPDGILINGSPPGKATFNFKPGATYRLRISNVGIKTSLNFRIQGHKMRLVEIEGSYTIKQYYDSLDIHVGQSYSVLVTADQSPAVSYYVVASARFTDFDLYGYANLNYGGSSKSPSGPIPQGPPRDDINFSMEQASSIRWDLKVGAARPNPQGSYHYGQIKIARTIVLQNDQAAIGNKKRRFTINNVSFKYKKTPLKLADYFKIPGAFNTTLVPDVPVDRVPILGTPVIDAHYKDFIEIIFQNIESSVQSWHLDGYNFFVAGMEKGKWNSNLRSTYNMVDAIFRSTVQVYPNSWTAILLALDNMGTWNIRSQDSERRYLGQEIYMRVEGDDPDHISPRDEMPFSPSLLLCGKSNISS
ncbi:L-ascorbate oxidase [Canna indica]|uniref:L-ascorbate oxidase n=1 Tax=Canna indica TaxID=4628 RepID=A0AAQ3K192_9LILI|nr:L-ascorbate oxidase [Canna indica]